MSRCTEQTSAPKLLNLNCITNKPAVTSNILIVSMQSSFGRQCCHLEAIQTVSAAAETRSSEQQLLTVETAVATEGLCLL